MVKVPSQDSAGSPGSIWRSIPKSSKREQSIEVAVSSARVHIRRGSDPNGPVLSLDPDELDFITKVHAGYGDVSEPTEHGHGLVMQYDLIRQYLENPPKNEFEARSLDKILSTNYPDYERTRAMHAREANRRDWSRVLQHLVFSGGLMCLGAALACLLMVAGLTPPMSAAILVSGLISAFGGIRAERMATRIWRWGSSRDRNSQDELSS